MKKTILYGILAILLVSFVYAATITENPVGASYSADALTKFIGHRFNITQENQLFIGANFTFGASCKQYLFNFTGDGGDGQPMKAPIVEFSGCVDNLFCAAPVNVSLVKGNQYVAGINCTSGSDHRHAAGATFPNVKTTVTYIDSTQETSGNYQIGNTDNYGGLLDIWTINATAPPPPDEASTINITSTNPTNTQYITTGIVNVNVLYDANNSNNVDLWFNSAFNDTNSESAGGGVSSNFSLTLADGTYHYHFNISDEHQNTTSTNITFYVDTTAPVENEITQDYYITQNLFLIVNLSDAFGIASVNISTCNTDIKNQSPTNPFYFNQSIDVTNCSYGVTATAINYCDTAGNCGVWNYAYTIRNRLSINATSRIDQTAITNFTVLVNSTEYGSTTNGILDIDNLTGQPSTPTSYNITIIPVGYESLSADISVNFTYNNYTFDLYTHNSVNITFKDEETKAIVENMSIEFISDAFNYNYTTLTGKLYVDLISPQSYTLRYNGFNMTQGYLENFYYFTLTNRTHNDLTLYIAKNTTGDEITATVYDEYSNKIEDVYIQTLRYDFDTNSYVLVSMSKTNFLGEAKLYLIKATEFYKFMIYYPLGTLKEETSPTYIYDDAINFQINLADPVAEDYFNEGDITHSLTFNNATNNFRYTYTDANSLLYGACLEVYQTSSFGNTLLNNTCITGATGTILGGITPLNDTTYLAKAYIQWDANDNTFLDSLYYLVYSNKNPFGDMGLIVLIILTMAILFIAIYSIVTMLVLIPVPTLLLSIMGIVPINIGLAIGLQLLGITLAVVVHRSG